METIEIRYRSWQSAFPPQPIKLKIPGWAGDSHEHKDGSVPQPWHCPPFLDGSTYGLELLFPFADTAVSIKDGVLCFEGDYSKEKERKGISWPPFEAFAPGHYGLTSSLDIVGPPDFIIRIEPHPSFYTDHTWTSPCPVPGHLQTEWWPRIFFVVFKSPPLGQTHYFRKGQPYAQILILPKKVDYDIMPMDMEEASERANLESVIGKNEAEIAENRWVDYLGHAFNDKYKILSRIFAKEGIEGVKKAILESDNKQKLKRRLVPVEKLQN